MIHTTVVHTNTTVSIQYQAQAFPIKTTKMQLIQVLPLLLLLLHPTASTTNSTHVCVSSFTTNQELAHFPWSSTTNLIQSIAPLTLDHAGTVTPSPDWPLASLVTWAHGNATRLWVGIKTASKSEAAQFLASSPALLKQTAIRLVNMVSENNYDGLQLDFEGLKMASKTGYETFVAACHTHCAALTKKSPNKPMLFMTTLYVDILLRPVSEPSAYDARYLSSFGNGLFIMGYDMTWLHTKPGTGWTRAGPNAPLNGLNASLHRAITVNGVSPTQIVLGLPAYGRVFTCDGDERKRPNQSVTAASFANCSCKEKNFHKKSLDTMAVVTMEPECTTGYDEVTATPYWDCPYGSNTTQGNNPQHQRQQGWYENVASMTTKMALMKEWGVPGLGLWSAHGIAQGTPSDVGIWDLLEAWQK